MEPYSIADMILMGKDIDDNDNMDIIEYIRKKFKNRRFRIIISNTELFTRCNDLITNVNKITKRKHYPSYSMYLLLSHMFFPPQHLVVNKDKQDMSVKWTLLIRIDE